jgi:hypothetical protein
MAEAQTAVKNGNGATALAMTGESALAKAPLEFVPQNIDEAWRMATMFSKAALLPEALRNKPSDVLLIMLMGRELGLSPLAALRGVYVVQGKPYISAQSKIALVRARKDVCKYFRCEETTPDKATFVTERVGDDGPTRVSFTLEHAKRAGLLSKQGNWQTYPDVMLRWRAASQLADLVYSDIIGGIGIHDEYEELKERDGGWAHRADDRARVMDEMTASMAPPEPPAEFNAETGEVVEAPVAPPPAAPAPSGGDPDSAAEAMMARFRTFTDERALKAIAKEVSASMAGFPADLQTRILTAYQEAKDALARKGGK